MLAYGITGSLSPINNPDDRYNNNNKTSNTLPCPKGKNNPKSSNTTMSSSKRVSYYYHPTTVSVTGIDNCGSCLLSLPLLTIGLSLSPSLSLSLSLTTHTTAPLLLRSGTPDETPSSQTGTSLDSELRITQRVRLLHTPSSRFRRDDAVLSFGRLHPIPQKNHPRQRTTIRVAGKKIQRRSDRGLSGL